MKRIADFKERETMKEDLLAVGFDYYNLPSTDGSNYWSDNVAYEFTIEEIDRIEDATDECHQMCMEIVEEEVKKGDYNLYNFNDLQKQLIETSWKNKDPHLYGRFDFGYDGEKLKMFEYNADTPTSLLEASVVQWDWLQNVEGVPNRDQFNLIHESLQKRLKEIKELTKQEHLYLIGMAEAGREDWGNLDYLADVAYSVGFNIHQLCVEEVGYNHKTKEFVDLQNERMDLVFKLYPSEWLSTSDFAQYVQGSKTKFIEPFWKMLLSNKVLMVKLWEKFKNHDLLLPAHFNQSELEDYKFYVKKPILGREGANISYLSKELDFYAKANGSEHSDLYEKNGFIYQEKYQMPSFDDMYPVIGSWVVGDKACGIGLREDFTPVTGNDSHFIPHYFVE